MDLSQVDTKLEAYKLVHDPTRLFSLLYSKYGDILEDYYLLITNQLVLNKSSHLNVYYKEHKIIEDKDEYLRRFYNKKETIKRIPKLNDYYKNYHIFFCKATLTDFPMGTILKNYEDNKAEIFYKNNYEDSNINKEEKSDKCESSTLSSLDNITYNKTIFDKRNKEIIEKDLDSKNLSLTLTLESLRNKNKSKNLIIDENSDKEDSFIQSIKNIVYYQENKNKKKKENNIKQNFKKSNICIKEITRKKNNNNGNNNNNNNNNKKEKINNLSNICKKINESIKSKKIKNDKIILEKCSNNNHNHNHNIKDNYYKLLNKLNIHNSLYSLSKKNIINDNNNNYVNNKSNSHNDNENKNNVFLSPQARKHYFTNITSRISEFNKNRPTNIKNSKRNKSYRINKSNNKKNHFIYQNPVMTNNTSKNHTHYPYTNQYIEYNINNLKNISITSKNKYQNSNYFHNKNNSNNIKSNPSQILKYNQFLLMNNKNTIKGNKNNKTFDLNLIGGVKNLKMLPKSKNFLYNLKKMRQSSNNSPIGLEYNGIGSKFTLFKAGVSPLSYHSINNKQKNNRHFNNFQVYNKLSMNQTTNFNEHQKYIMSNSIENNNNIYLKSLSPKAISSNITITNEKKRNLGFSKINFNKFNNNNNYKNQNISNKIKIPVRQNKNNISYSNSNYNINFNNLIFYSSNTPTSLIDDIKCNIISNNNNNINNNNNNNSNQNLNKINTNFYMMNFNNLYNSRNKVKISTSNYSSQNKVKTNTNSQSKILKKLENEKHSTNGGNMNEKKIPFTLNKQIIGKTKKSFGNIKTKEKSNINYKNNNIIKRKNNKSYNFNDNEKNNDNHADKVDKRKFSLMNLRGMSDY